MAAACNWLICDGFEDGAGAGLARTADSVWMRAPATGFDEAEEEGGGGAAAVRIWPFLLIRTAFDAGAGADTDLERGLRVGAEPAEAAEAEAEVVAASCMVWMRARGIAFEGGAAAAEGGWRLAARGVEAVAADLPEVLRERYAGTIAAIRRGRQGGSVGGGERTGVAAFLGEDDL